MCLKEIDRRYAAHMAAEQAMQDFTLLAGIGLKGILDEESRVYDHGRTIEYVNDPAVELGHYKIIQRIDPSERDILNHMDYRNADQR